MFGTTSEEMKHFKVLETLLKGKFFKQMNIQHGSKPEDNYLFSLTDFLIHSKDNMHVSYLTKESTSEGELDYLKSSSPILSASSKYVGPSSSIINIEIGITRITFDGQPSLMMTVENINSIIENQENRMQVHYQEAITATVSNEQMNPLNSIVNMSEAISTLAFSYLP